MIMISDISEKELPLLTGKSIHEITLSNGHLTIVIHDFGARIHQIFAPDKYGTFENILLSKDNSETYIHDGGYYGVICGPVAGRIAGASYGEIKLDANEGKNTLHSGSKGWERQFWDYEVFKEKEKIGIKLTLKDEQSGFPGNISVSVIYELEGSCLTVKMTGTSEKDTVFNPAFHPYFNLTADKESTLEHILQTTTTKVVEVDEENIPTGNLVPVGETVYDLRKPVSIRSILEKNPQGFDHCFVFPEQDTKKALNLFEKKSGRRLTCITDRQAVVIYTATNPEQESTVSGKKMTPNRGLAIEFQELPDIVHHPEWGTIELRAGEEKTFISTYTFSVESE
ncbi:MAG: galactose mutarotase [Streptococcaceae bacterium]|nr:galactose mutarotase [Streptococcaceae bacterium]